ncbi:MAG TPA: metal ABC transporter permease, partial [Chthoniobacterales bacterium]
MISWLTEPFQYEFMQRALLGSVIIGFTNGFLGAFIVLRRLALLADALSHSLLPGLALAAIFFGLAPAGLFFGALIATIFVGVGGQLIARSSRLKEDTAIGALFVFAFAIGVILLGYSKVRVDLSHFLFGNVLGISDSDLWISYGIGLVTMAFLAAQHRPLLLALFEPAVAATQGIRVGALNVALMILTVLAMISSLQAVGVVLSLGL